MPERALLALRNDLVSSRAEHVICMRCTLVNWATGKSRLLFVVQLIDETVATAENGVKNFSPDSIDVRAINFTVF